jgi:hypothetical protein
MVPAALQHGATLGAIGHSRVEAAYEAAMKGGQMHAKSLEGRFT